jgi:hypothetical protein
MIMQMHIVLGCILCVCTIPRVNNCLLRNNKTYICSERLIYLIVSAHISFTRILYFIASCALAGTFEMIREV